MKHAHWYCGSGTWMGHSGNSWSLLYDVWSLRRKTRRLGAGIIWKLLHSCLMFGDGCQLGPLVALHISQYEPPHSMVAGFQGQVSWEREQMLAVPFLWPSLGSHRAPPSATSIDQRSQVSQDSDRENIDLSFQAEAVCHNLNAFGIGMCVSVWSPFEIQSATLCICGEWSQ